MGERTSVERVTPRSPLEAALVVAGAGALWALLCAVLAGAGHAPSFVVVPIPRSHYYSVQAIAVVPVLLTLWIACSWTAHRAAHRLGGTGTLRATREPMALALAVPLIVFFIAPDFIVYFTNGFSALAKLVRITGPLSTAAALILATKVVRSAHGLSMFRSFAAALIGILTQGVVAGLLLK